MKKLYLIGGTMGAGKTSTCQILKTKLPDSLILYLVTCSYGEPGTRFVVAGVLKKEYFN